MRSSLIARTVAFGTALALAGCGESPTGSATAEPDATPTAEAPTPPNYVEHRKGVYYYVAAVSENDQKDGHGAGKAIGFKYLGKNADGEYTLVAVSENGAAIGKATCADPCKIIHDQGETFEYNPQSVIGSAFEDAINGRLEVGKRK